jgi:hypothetical protein
MLSLDSMGRQILKVSSDEIKNILWFTSQPTRGYTPGLILTFRLNNVSSWKVSVGLVDNYSSYLGDNVKTTG